MQVWECVRFERTHKADVNKFSNLMFLLKSLFIKLHCIKLILPFNEYPVNVQNQYKNYYSGDL